MCIASVVGFEDSDPGSIPRVDKNGLYPAVLPTWTFPFGVCFGRKTKVVGVIIEKILTLLNL